jgi:hypothetical protein
VTRVIVYCGFLQDENIKLPATGVGGSPVNVLGQDQLSLLWSEVAWPFEPAGLQQKEKSGRAYLERKADVFRLSIDHAASVKAAVQKISHGIQVREVKSGTRIFALVRRGDHGQFRGIVNALPLPDSVSRRVSGPWPAAEFLSSAVKMPQNAGQR